MPAVEVHIVDDKARIDCDIYIDDGMHNITSYRSRRPDSTVVRWVQPWNDPVDGVVDADDWATIRDLARDLPGS